MKNKLAIIIMGVSGSGKTTIGKMLALRLNIPFFDADDFHSQANKQKMADGNPLNDEDRKGWLLKLQQLITSQLETEGCVLACSALKESYRQVLMGNHKPNIKFIFLQGDKKTLADRLNKRKGHFFSASLLQSQLDTLEIPSYAFILSIQDSPETIVDKIMDYLQ